MKKERERAKDLRINYDADEMKLLFFCAHYSASAKVSHVVMAKRDKGAKESKESVLQVRQGAGRGGGQKF